VLMGSNGVIVAGHMHVMGAKARKNCRSRRAEISRSGCFGLSRGRL